LNGPSDTSSAGGVDVLMASANRPALSSASYLCFAIRWTLSNRARPGPNVPGSLTTTVFGSGAETSKRLPPIVNDPPSGLPTFGSYMASKENSTSAEVKGTPSDHTTPSRSVSV
jgi:hypothetical protein